MEMNLIELAALVLFVSVVGQLLVGTVDVLKRRRAQHQKQRNSAIVLYTRDGAGQVDVNLLNLHLNPREKRISPLQLVGIRMPDEAKQMLYAATPQEVVKEVLAKIKECGTEGTVDEDWRRGLTIGSALFKYSIPESFVLIDHRTRLLCALYIRNQEERHLISGWFNVDAESFRSQYQGVSGVERLYFGLTRDVAVNFYNQHHLAIAASLMAQCQGKYFPQVEVFAQCFLRRNKLTVENTQYEHCVRIVISLLSTYLDIPLPREWVMVSEMIDAVNNVVMEIVPPKPELKLVPKK